MKTLLANTHVPHPDKPGHPYKDTVQVVCFVGCYSHATADGGAVKAVCLYRGQLFDRRLSDLSDVRDS